MKKDTTKFPPEHPATVGARKPKETEKKASGKK